MLSALLLSGRSYPALAWAGQLAHQRSSHLGPLVLKMTPLTIPAPTTDRDRTVSRRSEPSSRDAFMGEQPNPWDLLQPQDAPSRHRGAKPCRRSEPLGASVTLWEATAPVKLPAWPCLPSGLRMDMRARIRQEWYFKGASPLPTGKGSLAPTYATHASSRLQTRV